VSSVGPYAASPQRHTYDTRMIRRIIRLGPYACWRRAGPEGPRASRKWPPEWAPFAPLLLTTAPVTPLRNWRACRQSCEQSWRRRRGRRRGRTRAPPSAPAPACPAAAPSRPAQQAAAGSPPSHRSCSACSERPWTMPWSDHFIECGVPFRHASSPSFKRVCDTLLRFGAPYTPPGR